MIRLFVFFFVLLLPLTAFTQTTFVSNALGMQIREIDGREALEYEYTLKVIEGEAKTTKLLFKNDREQKRWEIRYENDSLVRETIYLAGRLDEDHFYSDGKIESELYYDADKLIERREYSYINGALQEVAAFDGDNTEIYRDVYERSLDGRLRSIRRISQQTENLSSFTYSAGRLVGEWHATDDEGMLFRYHDGEKLSQETWEGLKLMLSEETNGKRVSLMSYDILIDLLNDKSLP